MKLLVQKRTESAQLPKRGSAGAAGYDLFSDESSIIPAGGQAIISTGLSIKIPDGHYGRLAPRSGLAAKHLIAVNAGVIDGDYTDEVKILLLNHGKKDYQVEKGDRVAQLIIEKISLPDVMTVDKLDDTVRGSGGFGSTGR